MKKGNELVWDDAGEIDEVFGVAPIKYYGEIFRGGVWLRVTGACETEQEAKKAAKKWREENPRVAV